MSRLRRYGLLGAGIAATLAAIVGVSVMMSADAQVSGSVVVRPFSWLGVAIAVLSVAGAAWLLLGQTRPFGSDSTLPSDHARCSACDREVFGRWRMCPYCGAMIEAPGGSCSGADQAQQAAASK